MRLDKFLSYVLDISRNDAKILIKSKQIYINDQLESNINLKINYETDKVSYREEILKYEPFIYLMVNKPVGYISSTSDKLLTVLDLVNEYKKHNLSIVGRLDKDSTGLILLTNDGDLLHKLKSPKYNIYKRYYVEVIGEFKETFIERFIEGISFNNKGTLYIARQAKLEIISKTEAYIEISEGKFHQVKLMCASLGLEVVKLKREKIGSLELDSSLGIGEYRKLTEEEVKNLKELVK